MVTREERFFSTGRWVRYPPTYLAEGKSVKRVSTPTNLWSWLIGDRELSLALSITASNEVPRVALSCEPTVVTTLITSHVNHWRAVWRENRRREENLRKRRENSITLKYPLHPLFLTFLRIFRSEKEKSDVPLGEIGSVDTGVPVKQEMEEFSSRRSKDRDRKIVQGTRKIQRNR